MNKTKDANTQKNKIKTKDPDKIIKHNMGCNKKGANKRLKCNGRFSDSF